MGSNEQEVTDRVSSNDRLMADMRGYFSIYHIQSAALFAREAAGIERTYQPSDWLKVSSKHQAYVVAAIFACAAFLEATINELFADAVDGFLKEYLEGVEPELVASLALEGRSKRFSGTMEKYNLAFDIAGHTRFDREHDLAQEAQFLLWLRNALIHYQPETRRVLDTAGNDPPPHRFESLLAGRFRTNPFAGEGNPFWPEKCLSHGCAAWGVATAISFVEEFTARMGTNLIISGVCSALGTD